MALRPRSRHGSLTMIFSFAETDSGAGSEEIDFMSVRLATFPHYRMTGSDACRLRVGDYRVIYRFNVARGEIYLLAIGNRREIYR